MKYILKQYNYARGVDISDVNFMTSLTDISFKSIDSTTIPMRKDNCLYNSNLYQAGHSYYFFGIIEKSATEIEMSIKLVNRLSDALDETTVDKEKIQYVKKVKVPVTSVKDYYTLEFVFTPIINFNSLTFEIESNHSGVRIGCIDAAELNDIIGSTLGVTNGSPLIRFSIQSIPGFLMCLNGEGIRVPRNGIYEIKNGIVLIDSFTPVEHCSTEAQSFINQKNGSSPTPFINTDLFGNPDRPFHSFTVDYLYYSVEDE